LSEIGDLLQAARAQQRRSDFAAMAATVGRALELQPQRLDVQFTHVEALICNGHIEQALARLPEIEASAGSDAAAWHQLLLFYAQLGRHQSAYACARRLQALAPESLDALFAVASAATVVGQTDEAESLLDGIIAKAPGQAEAYYARSRLRRQSRDRNHIAELKQQLGALPAGSPAEVPLCYALGKEYEDIGDHDESFRYVERGAAARRARLSYEVDRDVATCEEIIATFDNAWKEGTEPGPDIDGPVFVLGLPRSGTTLVDRILDAHPEVSSLGEVSDFAYAVMRCGGPASNKSDLIRNVAAADLAVLGESYWTSLQGYGEPGPKLIDKTPANYLYLGLIMHALPAARVVHVGRHPLASGYAMYKALFRMGYPFSYDLEQIGRYYAAYHRLMQHWHEMWPGRILDLSYENLVDDQAGVSRQIIAHCGLPWSDDCLTYHEKATPTATASAVQVREPIYREARDLWRRFEEQLEPLARTLREEGIDV
jgi:tetratricopeptide (TPR) repeat protein